MLTDILGREVKKGDLVVGMIISRDSDGMRFGVCNGTSFDFVRGHYLNKEDYSNTYLTRSVPQNIYLVTDPTPQEIIIRDKIVAKVKLEEDLREAEKMQRSALKRIPAKDLVVGEYYEDERGRRYFYMGKGTATVEYDDYGRRYTIESISGHIYMTVSSYTNNKGVLVFYAYFDATKNPRKLVSIAPREKVDTFNVNRLVFEGSDSERFGIRYNRGRVTIVREEK